MKFFVPLIICFFNVQFVSAQDISLDRLNSANILDYYDRAQMMQQMNQDKSIDIVTQMGIGNRMDVIDIMPNYIELTQSGNYNTILFVNPNDYPTNAQINVNGSGNYLDITGSNSISDGMKININANDTTIFMRNY